VLAAAREMNDAQQRLQRARMSYDRYLPAPGTAPDTYAEFLLRTCAPPRHEPTAAQRSAGRKVR
jgi:hypothetical protein